MLRRSLSLLLLLPACAAQTPAPAAPVVSPAPDAKVAPDGRVVPRGFVPAVDGPALAGFLATRGGMLGRPRGFQLTRDGKTVVFLRSGPREMAHSLWAFDVASGKERELLAPAKLLSG